MKRSISSALVAVAAIFVAPAISARYVQPDPIGLQGGLNPVVYVSSDPLRLIDPHGLTQTDIDNALAMTRAMLPNVKYPSVVRTWSQPGKAGSSSLLGHDIFVDSKYLECLNDGEASALLMTVLHEVQHFNQRWYEFGMDNVRERVTGGRSSRAQDAAEEAAFGNSALVTQYLKSRHQGKDACQCRK